MNANCSDGDVQLVRGNEVTLFEGRVEVCINNAWGTVSSKNFDVLEADVICRQKGFEGGGMQHKNNTITPDSSHSQIIVCELTLVGAQVQYSCQNSTALETKIRCLSVRRLESQLISSALAIQMMLECTVKVE